MKSQLTGLNVVNDRGALDELRGKRRRLALGEHPPANVATENIQHDVQVEVRLLERPEQFSDVPAPDLIRSCGQELRRRVTGMTQLIAALANKLMSPQHAIHSAD